MDRAPQVSVVIPTRKRPDLVVRAVKSALAQTLADIEVIVVIDGSDRATEQALAAIDDGRLTIICNEVPVGGSEARNVGIRKSRAPFDCAARRR